MVGVGIVVVALVGEDDDEDVSEVFTGRSSTHDLPHEPHIGPSSSSPSTIGTT